MSTILEKIAAIESEVIKIDAILVRIHFFKVMREVKTWKNIPMDVTT